MKLFIKVKTKSKKVSVKKIDETHFIVFVKEPPVQGKANQAVIENIAEYLGIAKSKIKITSGFASKQKIITIS